jgi:heme O synthase-like polyprenyltransferase
VLAVCWLVLWLSGFNTQPPKQWGRRMFLFSLVVITVLCIMVSVNSILP